MRPNDCGNQERTQRVCPEAQDFYPVTRDLFEEKIWNKIQTYWLQQPSCVTKETAWKLLEGLELNSLKSQPIYGEHGHDIEDAQELKILYSMTLQWTEPHLAYTSSKRHYKYWSIRWFDFIPGYNQTLFGSIECQPFFQDPPMHLSTEEYTRLSNKSRRGWQLQTHPSFTDALECFRLGAGLTEHDLSVQDMARCIIPAIGILARQHPAANKNNLVKRTMMRFERQVKTWNPNEQHTDPNEWETSEILYRRGGLLSHPKVVAALKRENRWDSVFPQEAQAKIEIAFDILM
jgi:hypothetical protein